MVNQTVYSVVIFSQRYLDRDRINVKTFVFLAVYWSIWTSSYNTQIKVQQFFNGASTMLNNVFNPILTGGGGQFDPPLHEIRDCLATATDRDTPFRDFFLSSLTHLLIPSLWKSDLRSRGHVTFCTGTSAQNLPKIGILHMFVYKTHGNYWFS